jgi:hypothetical protein
MTVKHKQINRAEARALFNAGHLVSVTRRGHIVGGVVIPDDLSPYSFHSAATRTWGLRTFEDVEGVIGARGVTSLTPDDLLYWERKGKDTYDVAAGMIHRREAFTVGRIRGDRATVGNLGRLGDLPPEERVLLGQAARRYGTQLYIVWSYDTPIAWAWPTDNSGEPNTYVPPVRYSNTTTQHQHLVATALGMTGFSASKSARKGKGKSPYGPRAGGW